MALSNLKETREWDVEATILTINLFKENRCLYDNTHKDYTNKEIGWNIISKIAKEIADKTGKECSVADLRKKLSLLWSQYLAEKQKIIRCKGTGEEYTPTEYWIPMLNFLDVCTNLDLPEINLESVAPSEPGIDLQLIKNTEHEPPKPPRRRKKSDNISMANFSISQPIPNLPNLDLHPHINAFSGFIKSELILIKENGGDEFFKKAKRKLQLALFEVWDEMETLNEDIE